MHTNILQKCLSELSAEAPRLDYVRGMLETLIELQGAIPESSKGRTAVFGTVNGGSTPSSGTITDEGDVLDALAVANLNRTVKLAAESQQ